MVTKEQILEKLKEIIDPELGINIVDLGFIYEIKIDNKPNNDGKTNVHIKMTFTTPACPLLNFITEEVKSKLNEIRDADFEVEIVFDPPWKPEMMTDEARQRLGMF